MGGWLSVIGIEEFQTLYIYVDSTHNAIWHVPYWYIPDLGGCSDSLSQDLGALYVSETRARALISAIVLSALGGYSYI